MQEMHTHKLVTVPGIAVEEWPIELRTVSHDYRSEWPTWQPYETIVPTLVHPYTSGDDARFVPTSRRVIYVWRAFDEDGNVIPLRGDTAPVSVIDTLRRWSDRRWTQRHAEASNTGRGEYRPTAASKARREVGDALARDAWRIVCDHRISELRKSRHVATYPELYGRTDEIPTRPETLRDEIPADESRADRQARRLRGGIPTRVVEPVRDADGEPTFDEDGEPITREVLRAVPLPYSDPFGPRPSAAETSAHSYHATLLLRADDPSHRHPTGDVRDRRTGALRASADPITRFDVRQIEPDTRHVSAGKRLAIVDRPAWRGAVNGKPIRKPSSITLNRHAHVGLTVTRNRGTDEYGVKLRDSYVPTMPVALYSPLALNRPDGMFRDFDLAVLGLPTDVWHVGLIGMTPAGGSASISGASPMLRRKRPANTRRSARAKVKRPAGSGKRGPAVTPFAMSARSLLAAVAARQLQEVAARLENMLRMSDDGEVIDYGNGVSVTIAGPAQVIDQTGRAFPVREWSRRAALSGITAS